MRCGVPTLRREQSGDPRENGGLLFLRRRVSTLGVGVLDGDPKGSKGRGSGAAGGALVPRYQSLQPPVREMAAQCVMRDIDPYTARTQLRLLGCDLAALDVGSDLEGERGRPPYSLATEEVTIEEAEGKTALIVGLPDGIPAYVAVGPPPGTDGTTFTGGSVSRYAEMMEPQLSCFKGLSGGPVIIPPESEGESRGLLLQRARPAPFPPPSLPTSSLAPSLPPSLPP